MSTWIGYALDGTLAECGKGNLAQIGQPIPLMVARCLTDLAKGLTVKIFTARVGPAQEEDFRQALLHHAIETPPGKTPEEAFLAWQIDLIESWCQLHLGRVLPITAAKDFQMAYCYDDRATQVVVNTGILLREVAHEGMQKILYLLEKGEFYDDEGVYTFPDGEKWTDPKRLQLRQDLQRGVAGRTN